MNIYVGNLPYSVDDDELNRLFATYGAVKSAQVIVDRRSQRSRGYGFVEMENTDEANKAISELNGSDYQGRSLRIDQSQPKSENSGARRKRRTGPTARHSRGQSRGAAPEPAEERKGLFGFIRKLLG